MSTEFIWDSNDLRTKKRSRMRRKLGGFYYAVRRHLLWHSGKFHFASTKNPDNLPYVQFKHSSLLLRKLKDVDMTLQYNKIQNLTLASARIDGILINPGETFSYWKTIGKPTYRKGYLDGMVLRGGTVISGCGGGLCQMSNLIFWMTLHTPLEVIERHRHGYDVFPDANRTQPFGSGATCFYPHGDLMIYNPTQRPFQLRVSVGKENLHGQWLSSVPPENLYKIVEKNHHMQAEWWGGYSRHNELYRQVFSLDEIMLNEYKIVENHAMMMYQPFLSYRE